MQPAIKAPHNRTALWQALLDDRLDIIATDHAPHTLEEKGCLRNQSPIVVPVDEQLPVIVWYNPVGLDSAGSLVFYEDIYRKFPQKKTETKIAN